MTTTLLLVAVAASVLAICQLARFGTSDRGWPDRLDHLSSAGMSVVTACALTLFGTTWPEHPRYQTAYATSVAWGLIPLFTLWPVGHVWLQAIEKHLQRGVAADAGAWEALHLAHTRLRRATARRWRKTSHEINRPAASKAYRFWHGPPAGRWIAGGLVFTVIFVAEAAQRLSNNEAPGYAYLTRFFALYGSSLLFCLTLPVGIVWFLLVMVHGQPDIRATLKRCADTFGVCSILGLLSGAVAYMLSPAEVTLPAQYRREPDIGLLLNLSVIGGVLGFALAHFVALDQARRRLSPRESPMPLRGLLLVPALLCVATLITQTGPMQPRLVATRLLDQYTVGVKPPADAALVPKDGSQWQLVFAYYHDSLIKSLPSTLMYTILVTAIATLFSLATLARAWAVSGGRKYESGAAIAHWRRGK